MLRDLGFPGDTLITFTALKDYTLILTYAGFLISFGVLTFLRGR